MDYAASTAEGLQLNARLFDVFPDGKAVMVDRGVRRVTSQSGTVSYQLQGNGWRFEPGHRIRVEIAQDDYGYVKASSIPSTATIAGVRVRMPVREPQPPALEDYRNASKFCKAERDFFGEQAFAARYGGKTANAHGKCVSQNN